MSEKSVVQTDEPAEYTITFAPQRNNDNFSTLAQLSYKASNTVEMTDLSVDNSSPQTEHRQRYLEPTLGASTLKSDDMLKTSSVPSRTPNLSNAWEFAGWGSTSFLELHSPSKSDRSSSGTLLGQWRATSISGNDLIASVFYTIAVVIATSGKYAPISLLIVSLIIYPFKNILNEVGTTLPLNGGAYNCLLNTAPKWFAAIAAAVSILDYIATAVVSAATATAYAGSYLNLGKTVIFWMTIGVLCVFAGIVLLGIRDSATVALAIFLFHNCVLSILMVAGVVRWISIGNGVLSANWNENPSENVASEIFYGVCIGLLGITGYEHSSDYIEDQKPGVFPKTMRNMWVNVSLINAPLTLITLAIMPLGVINEHPEDIISVLGEYAAGSWLRILVTVDAAIVLGAGVLTGIIGVNGLVERMASDQILPQFFLIRNSITGTKHFIILGFLVCCVVLYAVLDGDVTSLAGVFAVSFLSVLCMFAIGNILLKYKRHRLYRPIKVSTGVTMFGFASLFITLLGNIVIDPSLAKYFFIYFAAIYGVMMIMLNRIWILKTTFFYLDKIVVLHKYKIGDIIIRMIKSIKQQPVIFFTNTDDIHILNKVILYIKNNELTGTVKFIHLYSNIDEIPPRLESNHRILDELYPKIQIDLMFIQCPFNPETVDAISSQLDIPKSLMFISCPGENFPYRIGEFHGLRTIML
ncbi:9644_t:CDS:2 [Paraglomus occultum]|uniref:9644_t:CDS:1 n=1 Tax=Paraglomus occultum TaxID=144539 RepID=A0A9N8W4I5_9GLOM|nr:9644_t:CDS:2 [Paraglomus occultum]